MNTLRIVAWTIVVIYVVVVILLYTLQTKLIFYPGKLSEGHKFKADAGAEEIILETADHERISCLFFPNKSRDVILYFHGNAGDLSGWQFVAEDFTAMGHNFMIIDYRGYGKSSGNISEKGMYIDAEAAYNFLLEKGFGPTDILIYGRSIGSGVAVHLAAEKVCKGLILESPFSDLPTLANEKFPLFFPSLYLRYKFDNLGKINHVKSGIIFLHGSNDTLIPPSHSRKLFDKFKGRKKMIIVEKGGHNDLFDFPQFEEFRKNTLAEFFGHQ